MRPGPRVISSRKSESALVGIHGRAELSGTEVSESNSAPPILTEDVPFRIFPHLEGNLDGSAPRSCSNVSSSDTFHETFLESLSGKHLRDVGECNPFALSRAIRRNWRQRTIWSMLSRIDEIPLQVEGMLTKTASDLSMQVDGGVVQMQDHLRVSSGGQQVAENLENLPRHFATSVEANLMDAAALLRETVLQVTAELSARDFEAEDIVQEIQVIPQRVRKVADEAISRAVKTSVEELHQQLDEALGVLGSSTCEKELLQHLDQLPVVMQKRIVATGAVVDLAEDQIVDLAADLKSEFVPNHELMEALLRAKTAHEIGVVTLRYETDMEHEKVDTAQRLEKLKQTDESKFQNPGSFGHPEMCTRPCLFFAAGQCQNKDSCEFCHLPHNRRPTHLDKRNRELLKSFSSEETLATILPILSEKLQKYYSNSSALQLLMELEALSANSNADILESMSTTSSKQIARGERTLKSALRAVTLRSLLTLLLRTLPKDGKVRNVVEAIISSLRQPVSSMIQDV